VEVDFEVPPEGVGDEVTLRFRGLTPQVGSWPVDVTVNGTPVLSQYRIPNGGEIPLETWHAVRRDLFAPGTNTLCISVRESGTLWLYRVLLESIGRRNSAEGLLLDSQFTEPVLTYRTERRAVGGCAWQAGPPLTVYIDSGERGMPANLGWRSRSGAEGTLVFSAELHTSYGQWRSPDGTWHDMRCFLDRRDPASSLDPERVQRYRTEASWEGAWSVWNPGHEVEWSVDTGDGPLEHLSWRDQRESSAAVTVAGDRQSFTGWSQRALEGSVGFRGTAIAVTAPQDTQAPEPGPGEPQADATGAAGTAHRDALPLQPELEEVARAVGNLVDVAVQRLSAWLG